MAALKSIARRTLCCALLLLATGSFAGDQPTPLLDTVKAVENRISGRIGVVINDSGSDWAWGYRADERFPMNSTFKSLLCGATLAAADAQTLSLDETVMIEEADVLEFAPATTDRVGQDMTLGELCYGTLDKSDNTAANLLIERLGGTTAITEYLRSIGDPVTRLDRMEPEMNLHEPGDPRDTTTPSAMTATWEKLLLGGTLSPASQAQLALWMADGWATGKMIRSSLPDGWSISDKSGGGRTGSRSVVAMITPAHDDPFFVAIYISESPEDWDTRNAAITEIGAAVVALLQSR